MEKNGKEVLNPPRVLPMHDRTQEGRIKKEVLKRLRFFHYFLYFPLEEELYRFLPVKVSKKKFKNILKDLVGKGRIKDLKAEGKRFLLSHLSPKFAKLMFLDRVGEYRKKLFNRRFQNYIKILRLLPQIRFVGLSGSLAWGAADKADDIDLFIITKKGRLWTGRFLAVVLAFLLGIKRKREEKKAPGKACLNLFFDEGDLEVPEAKQSEYVAFELLALKPLFDKGVYEKFLQKNKALIKRYFPNAEVKPGNETERLSRSWKLFTKLGDFLEFVLGRLQLFLINRHKTHELVTSTQLWFFPEDFEGKYKKLVSSSK